MSNNKESEMGKSIEDEAMISKKDENNERI